MLAGLEHAHRLRVGEHGARRVEAAGQRLADQRQVGLHALVLLGQQPAGAAEAGLYLVEHHDHADAAAHASHGAQIAVRRDDHAGLALDRLDQDRHRARVIAASSAAASP